MTTSQRSVVGFSFMAALSIAVEGCGVGGFSSVAPVAVASSISVRGSLRGGQQPVSGAAIQLYAVNTTTDRGASTPLLSSSVLSDRNGNFSITGDYSCPSSNPLVYLTATGGNPGLGGSVNNGALAMMSLLGTCNDLLKNASTTFLFVDELTTVVSVYALSPFMTDYAHVGASASNANGLGAAFETSQSQIDFTTGNFTGGGQNLSVPEETFNSLADIIGACVNSAGGTAGDSSVCGKLFSNTSTGGTPTDTVTAALHMAQSPSTNTTTLFGMIPATAPFQPYFTSAPSDFTATTGYTLPYPGSIRTGALASNGAIWLYTAGYTYDTVANMSTNKPGLLTVYDNNFNQLFTIAPGTGGLYFPTSMAADVSGNVWVVNSNNTISKFNSSGAALSPSGGWVTPYASSFSPTGTGNTFQFPNSGIGPVVTDRLGGVHGQAPMSGSNPCYFDMNSSGVVSTVSGNYCSMLNSADLQFLTVDGAGDIWAGSFFAIGKEDASNGNLAANAPTSAGCFSSGGSTFQLNTQNLLYDHVHNYVWGHSELGAGAITNAAAAVFCDSGSSMLPVIPVYSTSSTAVAGSPYSSGSLVLLNGVLDGAGNFWYITGGVSATGTVGSVGATFNGSAIYSTYLNGISPTGALLTTYNAGSGAYGLQPAGLGTNVTATGSNISIANFNAGASLLGVDNSGNIWAYDGLTNKLLKIAGIARPNTDNY